MNIRSYLSRIGIPYIEENTIDFLRNLQYRHVTQIPFENMDILRGSPLSLDPIELYKKIVKDIRGGVCYELNGLFHTLLRELGFSVSMVAATVKIENGWFIEGTHAINIVHLNDVDYLVDVGFGGRTPRRPIPLTGEEIQDTDGYYRIRPYQEEQGVMVFEMKETTEWESLYKFHLQKKVLGDFKDVCVMTQCSTESRFNKTMVAMILTEQGRVTLHDHSLTIVNGEDKTKETIEPESINRIIKEVFKIG